MATYLDQGQQLPVKHNYMLFNNNPLYLLPHEKKQTKQNINPCYIMIMTSGQGVCVQWVVTLIDNGNNIPIKLNKIV